MELSVVIPTYRKPGLLERTLAALEPQLREASGRAELVVVDDGSGDRTGPLLQEWSARVPLVAAGGGSNEGRARARNRGWRAASGAAVLFLDDDILLEQGALAAHLAAQRRRPAVWMGEVRTDPAIVDGPLFDYLDSRGIAKHEPGAEVPARYLLTQNVSVPRVALEAIGGFDEDFGQYGFEDMELAFRLEDHAGMTFHHLPGATGWHVHHHTLDEYLGKKRLCGLETLPRIAELHPGRVGEMKLDRLPGLPGPRPRGRAAVERALFALSLALGGRSMARAILPVAPRPLRHRAYDYLVAAAYTGGLRQRAANMAAKANG